MGSAPGWAFGYPPTAGEWDHWFSVKLDDPGLTNATLSALVAGAGAASGFPALNSSGLLERSQLMLAQGTITFATSSTTTSTSIPGLTADSLLLGIPYPTTANAAAALASTPGVIWAITTGALVATHASNSQADRTFKYVILL